MEGSFLSISEKKKKKKYIVVKGNDAVHSNRTSSNDEKIMDQVIRSLILSLSSSLSPSQPHAQIVM